MADPNAVEKQNVPASSSDPSTDTSVVTSIESVVFENLTFAYEGAPELFSGVTLELKLGKNILVTGAAGNGQSTFLKLLAVLVQPQKGGVLINGQNTSEMSFEELQPIRRRLGYSFDYGGLLANRTLLDNLTLGLLYHKILSPSEAEAEARKIAERFRFAKVLGLRPASVSGGLRKLVCVLRAVMLKPELFVMDDPFTGLDRTSANELVELLGEMRAQGILKHVYLTSREESWAERLGCEPMVIERGMMTFATNEAERKGA
jgi:ABC-type transporter Mla maintaining outer membrane lipid asymmetry ATPase subunit MlaF